MNVKIKVVLFNQWLFLGKKKCFGLSAIRNLLCIPFSSSVSAYVLLTYSGHHHLKVLNLHFGFKFWIHEYKIQRLNRNGFCIEFE